MCHVFCNRFSVCAVKPVSCGLSHAEALLTYCLTAYRQMKHNTSVLGPLVVFHRRRIYTEEKAKVVAISWGTEMLQFLAALAILHQDYLKNRLNCIPFFNWCKSAYSIIQIALVQNS